MKKLPKKEFIIGLCVAIALVVLFFGIDYLKGINIFTPSNFYYAEYDNAGGLVSAAPVQINGYKVGQVREVQFPYEGQGKIKVLLALDKKLKLPEGSKATIEQSLLSGAYVDITLGNGKEILPVGSTLASGTSSDMMATLSNEVLPQFTNILPLVDSLLYNLNVLVADPALLSSIQRLDGISAELLLASRGLNTTMNSDVPSIMRSTKGTLGNIDKITYSVDTITSNLAQLSKQLKNLPLEPTMQNVNALTANLEQFSRQLNDKNSTLGLLTSDPELYNRITRLTADVDSLILDIQRNPKRYISIKLL